MWVWDIAEKLRKGCWGEPGQNGGFKRSMECEHFIRSEDHGNHHVNHHPQCNIDKNICSDLLHFNELPDLLRSCSRRGRLMQGWESEFLDNTEYLIPTSMLGMAQHAGVSQN